MNDSKVINVDLYHIGTEFNRKLVEELVPYFKIMNNNEIEFEIHGFDKEVFEEVLCSHFGDINEGENVW